MAWNIFLSAFPSIIIINSPNLKNNWSYPVRTAGNHFVFTLHPTFHDGTSLQSGINVSADGVPKFSTAGHLRSACHSIGIRCEMWQPTTPAQQTSKKFLLSHLCEMWLCVRKCNSTAAQFLLSHLCEMWPYSTRLSVRREYISTLTSLRDVTGVIKMLRKCFAISTLTSLRDVTIS